MDRTVAGTPLPLLHNLKHNKVLHERVILLTIVTAEVPYVLGRGAGRGPRSSGTASTA